MPGSGKRAEFGQRGASRPEPAVAPEQVLAHLETVLASPVFRTSKRSQKLLRFVVENAVLGRTDLLKERTIGIEVFSRPAHYEPSEDAIVRVNANEVRKRLAQYYLQAGREGVWIDLPAGSYVPEFHLGPPAAATPAPSMPEPTRVAAPVATVPGRRRGWLLAAAAVVVTAAAAGAALWFRAKSPLEEFWAPMLVKGKTPLVSTPIGSAVLLSYRLRDELTRQNPPFSKRVEALPGEIEILPDQSISRNSMLAVMAVALFIQGQGRTPEIRLDSQLDTNELRGRPVVLLGAFNNPWTLELNREIRFAFERQDQPGQAIFAIQDRKDPERKWVVYGQPRFGYDTPEVDYAVVTRVFDPATRQAVISAAGITQHGTRAAAEFITNPVYWQELAKTLPRDWKRRNLQVVLQTNVVLRTPKPPRVVATHCW